MNKNKLEKGRETRDRLYTVIRDFKISHGGLSPTRREMIDLCAGATPRSSSHIQLVLLQMAVEGRVTLDDAWHIGLPGESYIPPGDSGA